MAILALQINFLWLQLVLILIILNPNNVAGKCKCLLNFKLIAKPLIISLIALAMFIPV
jgi:hypothetical protein